jgi:DGQHR domain-containing protein
MRIPVIRLKQGDATLYLGALDAQQLYALTEKGTLFAPVWKRERPEGYQREPDERRVERISRYLQGELGVAVPIMPQAILLNAREANEKLRFEQDIEPQKARGWSSGYLEIPDDLILYEVDGQHRVKGIAKFVREKPDAVFQIPIVITSGLQDGEEAIQFVVINTTQKKVPPDLTLRVLKRRSPDYERAAKIFLGGEDWRLAALETMDALNQTPDSPWKSRIAPLGRRSRGTYMVSERNFVDSLAPVFSGLVGEVISLPRRTSFLLDYWKGLSRVCGPAFQGNPRRYVIQKSQGIFSLHWIAPFIFALSDGGKTSLLDSVFERISAAYPVAKWESRGQFARYNGKRGFGALAEELAGSLIGGFRISEVDEPEELQKVVRKARTCCQLRYMRPLERKFVEQIPEDATGAYVLLHVSLDKKTYKVYVGKSDPDLRKRLRTHQRAGEYQFLHWIVSKSSEETEHLECCLFHLLNQANLQNAVHPALSEGRICPWCK